MKLLALALALQAHGAVFDGRAYPDASPHDCARIKAAHRNTHDVSHRAWGWKEGVTGADAMIPFLHESALGFAKGDARALDAFVSLPLPECSALQSKAAALRPQLAQYAHLLEAARPFCKKPNSVVGGECGRTLGRALRLGHDLRGGAIREFQAARSASPVSCRNASMDLIELIVPPCERAARNGGRLCDQLDVAGARRGMANASAELRRIKDREILEVATATIASIDRTVSLFDEFSSRNRSEDRLVVGAAIVALVSNNAVVGALRCNFCGHEYRGLCLGPASRSAD